MALGVKENTPETKNQQGVKQRGGEENILPPEKQIDTRHTHSFIGWSEADKGGQASLLCLYHPSGCSCCWRSASWPCTRITCIWRFPWPGVNRHYRAWSALHTQYIIHTPPDWEPWRGGGACNALLVTTRGRSKTNLNPKYSDHFFTVFLHFILLFVVSDNYPTIHAILRRLL